MTMHIRKAERLQVKLRLALSGVSGSGKTLSAIHMANGIGGRYVIIDTENKSADLYCDKGDFDVLELEPPFSPDRYIEAIQLCENKGYSTIIIDSLSHAWMGEGGVLDIHDKKTNASSSKNGYMAWKEVTPMQNKLVNSMLSSKCHIIVTMRSKQHHDIVEDEKGKKRPIKMGLAPIQRADLDYEFTVVLDLDKDSHLYTSSKDRTEIFEGNHELITKETGVKLMNWLSQGKNLQDEIKNLFEMHKERLENARTIDDLRKEFEAINANSYLAKTQEKQDLIKIKDDQKSKIIELQSRPSSNTAA
jgi:hypothetical protein